MTNTDLLRQTIDDRGITLEELHDETGIPVERLKEILKYGQPCGIEIQTLASALEMSNPLRRNVFFNRNLPLD